MGYPESIGSIMRNEEVDVYYYQRDKGLTVKQMFLMGIASAVLIIAVTIEFIL